MVNDGAGYPGPPVVFVTDSSGSNAVILAAISSSGVVTRLTVNNQCVVTNLMTGTNQFYRLISLP